MPGTTINLFTLREWDFSNLTNSTALTVVGVKSVPVEMWTEGALLVRIHANTISGSGGGTIVVQAKPILLSEEDPAQIFIDPTVVATVTVATGDTAPKLMRNALSAGFGGALQIQVVGNKGTSAVVKATLSADLVMKS